VLDPQQIQAKFPQYEKLKEDLLRVNEALIRYRRKMHELVLGGTVKTIACLSMRCSGSHVRARPGAICRQRSATGTAFSSASAARPRRALGNVFSMRW